MSSMKTISLNDLEAAANEQDPRPQHEQPQPETAAQHVERIGRNIAETTLSLVAGDRQKAYDHPFNNMERTARIWEGILGIPVTGGQVALCMVGVKLAREAHTHKADNLVDMFGYNVVYEAWREIAQQLSAAKAEPNGQ